MNKYRIWIALLFLLSLTSCKCKDQKQIDNWDFGKAASVKCPVFGTFPLFVHNKLPATWKDPRGKVHKTGYEKALKKAMARWNKEAHKLGFPNFFETHSAALVAKLKPKVAPRQWPVVVYAQDAPKSQQKFSKSCELMKLGKSTFVDIMTMAWMEYMTVDRGGKKIWTGGRISFCIEKYEQGRRLMATPAAQKVRIMGAYGFFLHELGHALIGRDHVKLYGEIMRKAPGNHAFSYQLQELLRQRVVGPCRASGAVK